jgi:hypothetical protein
MSGRWTSWILFWGIFAAGFLLFTRHADFPFYYHPDEPGKVGQLIKNKRNFHHPMLMLTTTDLVRRAVLWGDEKKDAQRVVEVGRWVTAAWAALGVAALALLAARLHGFLAGVLAGAMMLANALLFELAHYLKEDPHFFAGIALTLLALHHFHERLDRRSILLLGGATALAAAGKYIGFALLPVMAGFVLATRGSQASWRLRLGWFLGSFALVWLALNWWIIKSPELIWESISEETGKAFGGEDGPIKSVPHAYYAIVQLDYGSWAVVIAAAVGLVLIAARRLRLAAAEWVWLGLAIGLFAVFSFTPKTSPRYYLPISVAVSYFAALGAWGLAHVFSKIPRIAEVALALLLAAFPLYAEAQQVARRYAGFAHDDRVTLETFVRQQLPKTAVLVQDESSNLPEPTRRPFEHAGRTPLTQRLEGDKKASALGTLSELRRRGVTHLAICARTYQRFLLGDASPDKLFYQTALKRGVTLFSTPPGTISYLQPGLILLDITALE